MPEKPVNYWVRVKVSSTTVRDNFRDTAQNLGRLVQGSQIHVMAEYKGWLRFVHWRSPANGGAIPGWINAEATELMEEPSPPAHLVSDASVLAALKTLAAWLRQQE